VSVVSLRAQVRVLIAGPRENQEGKGSIRAVRYMNRGWRTRDRGGRGLTCFVEGEKRLRAKCDHPVLFGGQREKKPA